MMDESMVLAGRGRWMWEYGTVSGHVKSEAERTSNAAGIDPAPPMTWSASERASLRSVIDVARRELRDRDPDDVPAKLRKVAASSARTLPPPLEKALVDFMIADDAFRSAVAERWVAAEMDDPIGTLFLDQPDRAREAASAAASADAERSRDAAAREEARRIEVLEAKLDEARTRISELRKEHAAELGDQRAADRSARRQLIDRALDAERMLEASERRRSALVAERDDLLAGIEVLEQRLRDAQRRASAGREQGRASAARSSFVPADPVDMARHLDRIERLARPYRHADGGSEPYRRTPELALPAGLAPDIPEAMDAVADLAVDLVIVDGYNVAGLLLDEGFHRRAGRERVASIANEIWRRTGARVLVVYDAVGVEGRSAVHSDLGVDVVFSQGRSADDEIVATVAELDARIVVITNDRELRERCAPHGALTVWSDSLLAWSNP
jgi:hypothetical protein